MVGPATGTLLSEGQRLDEAVRPLVWRAKAGDEEALTRVLEWCRRRIYRWALGITSDADDADDVTQEVLITLHWKLRSFREESRFTTWLYRVTKNAALGLMRRRQRRQGRQKEAEGGGRDLGVHNEVERDQLHGLHLSEVGALVRTLFHELPERQREIFDLVDLQGFAPIEVADMLALKPVTVRAHLFKARRQMRMKIVERNPEIAEEFIQ